jgi:hypothetical protein
MEIVAEGDAVTVRVAERGVSNRDSIAGAATAEAVLSGLFDLEPTFLDLAAGRVPTASAEVPGIGTLHNVNVNGRPADSTTTSGDDLVLSTL